MATQTYEGYDVPSVLTVLCNLDKHIASSRVHWELIDVMPCLRRLPQLERQVVGYVGLLGLTRKEAASRLDLTPDAVDDALQSAAAHVAAMSCGIE